jgi:hypothetical protein
VKPNRCTTHPGFVEHLEPFREATADEMKRYPYVGQTTPTPLVAKARCNVCEIEVLAIQWDAP